MGPYETSGAIKERLARSRRELTRWKLESVMHQRSARRCTRTNTSDPASAALCHDLYDVLLSEICLLRELEYCASKRLALTATPLIRRIERLGEEVNRTLAALQRNRTSP